MANQYDKLRSRFYPEETLNQVMTQYYGEENAGKVKSAVSKDEVIFLFKNEFMAKLQELFREKYQSVTNDFALYALVFRDNLATLFTNPESFNPVIFKTDADIAAKLGINILKIIHKDEATNKIVLTQGKETEKLRMLINGESKKLADIKFTNTISIIYNQMVSSKQDCKLVPKIVVGGDLSVETEEPHGSLNIEGVPEMKCFGDLREKLDAVLSAKGDILSWEEDDVNFFISVVNQLFERNYSSVQEIIQDPTMQLFLKFRNQCSELKEKAEKALALKNNLAIISKKSTTSKESVVVTSLVKENVAAWENVKENQIVYILGDKDALKGNTVVHELNHTYANGRTCGDEGLDEIINEFITERIVEGMSEEQKNKLNIVPQSKRNCAYSIGVEFMRPFLMKFEKEIKMARTNHTDLRSVLGDEIFTFINAIAEDIRKCNWGDCIRPININGVEIVDINQFMEEYSKNPNMELPSSLSENEKFNLEHFIMYKNYINDVIARYDETHDLTHESIEVRGVSLTNNETLTKSYDGQDN